MVILGGLDRSSSKAKFSWQEAKGASESGNAVVGTPRLTLFRWAICRTQSELGSASVPKRLIRSVSRGFRKMGQGRDVDDEGKDQRTVSGCLRFHLKGGGCRVGADMIEECQLGRRDGIVDCTSKRNSVVGEEAMSITHGRISTQSGRGSAEIERTSIDCFASRMAEMFLRRNSWTEGDAGRLSDYRGQLDSLPMPSNNVEKFEFSLPDEILEMCLARVPFTTVMSARLVCKRWRALTSTPHFVQIRHGYSCQSPWLFLFGGVKNGCYAREIQALDVPNGCWHKINVNVLRGRFLFSVASVGTSIYVIGGCSGLSISGKVEKTAFKTHRSVLVFSPFIGMWVKASPMKTARSAPVLGVLEADSDSVVLDRKLFGEGVQVQQPGDGSCQSMTVGRYATASTIRHPKSHLRGVSDVYQDPHRLSQRRQLRDLFSEIETSSGLCSSSSLACGKNEVMECQNSYSGSQKTNKYLLIAVGGQGSWDQTLNTAEMYDPETDKWTDVKSLPADFGAVRSGVVCKGKFYVYSESDKLAAYDPEMGVWLGIQTANLPPRLLEYFPKLVSCDGRLFMLCVSWSERDGDFNRQERAVRKLWELDLSLHVWAEISRHPDAPMDWNAAFVAHGDKIYGIEMFKIFGQVLDFMTVCCVSDSLVEWSHISRKHVKIDLDASSCLTKSMVMLNL